ncbi:MAG: CheR family methyltransferase [Coleofasciculaceae cyanobacterium]
MQQPVTGKSAFQLFVPPTYLIKVSQAAIEALLQQKIGLNAKTIGSKTIARAINRRMLDCSLSDLTIYLKLLQTSTKELETLIENIVIPETWFFRDRKPFDFLSQYVKNELLPMQRQSLRVLSVPCSTGEEPYSIAITLLEAGLKSKDFSIDAVDISKKSLLRAQRGVYSQNSFRGCTTAFQQQYFTQIEDAYHLDKTIINNIKFMSGNLLDPQFSTTKKPYHIIFCRNLLIYLEQSAREKVVQLLGKLLNNHGLLFLGYSETGQILSSGFVPVRYPNAFAFRKESDTKSLNTMSASSPKSIELPKTDLPSALTKKNPKKPHKTTFKSSQNNEKIKVSNSTTLNSQEILFNDVQIPDLNLPNSLKVARNFADKGQLKEAASLCKSYLSENPLNAETYFLLGQVYQAEGNEQYAEQYFQKAIYLDPNHYEALIHLALLKEYYGDQKSAIILRQRIERL